MSRLEELKKSSKLISEAYSFAKKAHSNQRRFSGRPYFTHLIETAEYLANWGMDEQTVAAGLLHDVVEDTNITSDEIEKNFGKDIRTLVDGVTKLGQVKYLGDKTQAENLRKLILAMAKDLRVILIKLADRRHNMKTLAYMPPDKQKRIAIETMEIYAPLAYRLGMQKLSGELQDLSFPYVSPEEYKWLIEHIKEQYEDRESYLKKLKPIVEKSIKEHGISLVSIDFRAKRYTSLYKKLLMYDMDIDKIYDLVAFRIIVNDIEECYATLGVIHSLWTPIPGRFKDYIAMPKPNGYRSLHTTILGPDKRIIEFQMRTTAMHERAENGIAAHWIYKERGGKKRSRLANEREIKWLEQLRSWQKAGADSQEFIDAFKIDFLSDRILALTPKGEVIDLPYGSTPVDFAYRIHTDIGNQCIGAKVNGKIVSLDHKLNSSDVVEILTQKNKKPSASWLEFVVTPSAKDHIRNALKTNIYNRLVVHSKNQVELKIIAEDKVGLLKDISGIISRSHVNIVGIKSSQQKRGSFHIIKVNCEINNKKKILKIILKLKSLKEIKEIDYRFV